MDYMTNREFAELEFRRQKRNEYVSALMEEVRQLREEKQERERGCEVCNPDNRQYHFRGNPPNFCPYCGKRRRQLMNADEIVRTLRENAEWCDANEYEVPLCMGDNQRAAADLIESMQVELADYHHISKLVDGKMKENQRLRRINENLQARLSASQRRENAAVEDLIECMTEYAYTCKFCSKWNGKDVCKPCKPQWRGPQEAGEGVAENG